ncbi:MAG: SDR family oxidoreductase [Minisyncoccia bacterium]|jgi:3-oxoacyl-[acyl-carrier protein] reductase
MKNILVTGVSRGMGEATARLLVQKGFFVYGVYNTNKAEANKLVEELKNIKVFQCDFSDRHNTMRLLKELSSVSFDGIVNSAGVFVPIEFDNLKMEDWDRTIEINFNTPLIIVHGLKNQLAEGASIVNISSIDAMVGGIDGIAYAASKAALLNLTKSLAVILSKKKVRVNAIAPGWIGDGMQAPPDLLKEAADMNPLKRNGTYEDIAQLVFFLLSNNSSYINGTTITIDGGDTATTEIYLKEAEMLGS